MNPRIKGVLMVLAAAICWGSSGIFLQQLLDHHYSVGWLISTRFTLAGLIMLLIVKVRLRQSIWEIWKNKQDAISLLLLSLLGFLSSQLTFIFAIKHSNAVTAIILGYLAPAIIVLYFALRLRRFPSLKEIIAVILAIVGTFFVVTQGKFSSLSISGWALIGGILSACGMAFYSIQPQKLLAKWNSILVIGWGMFVGGIVASLFFHPWKVEGIFSLQIILAYIGTVILGLVLSYTLYIESLKFINASIASMVATFEPLYVAIISAIWLQIPFTFMEWLGLVCIISTVMILSMKDRRENINPSDVNEAEVISINETPHSKQEEIYERNA